MKQLVLLLSLTASLGFSSCRQEASHDGQSVNPLIGDASFISKYGTLPTDKTNEQLRVSTHLEYVEYLLRQKPVAHLAPELQQKREKLLDLLHDYRTTGVFPANYDYAGIRKPCFIDEDGRICAVGYLVEQTAGRATAETINSKYKYEELLAMNDETVDAWISKSGLSKEEAAMIQPSYGWAPPENENNRISKGYGISSGVISGINVSLMAANGAQMLRQTGHSRMLPLAGIVGGVGQIVLGTASIPDDAATKDAEGKAVLSYFNIGVGTASILMSTWNLLSQKKPMDRRTTWNVYSVPTPDNSSVVGLSVTRRF